jgi:arsenite-transporting ATPase
MRIILYVGKGGVGKTSIAAATAIRSAESGKRTIVVSADAAHSLGDSFDIELSSEPARILENLWAQEIDATNELEKFWGKMQKNLTALFGAKVVNEIANSEMIAFHGFEDLLSLFRILRYCMEGEYDVIVIDCAPTGETLAMLSYPELLRRWLMVILRTLNPSAAKIVGKMNAINEIESLCRQFEKIKLILSNRDTTSIRVVVNPEKMVVKEAQRSFTYLNMYDFNVDAVMVNKLIPDSVSDDYFVTWKDSQRKYVEMISDSFQPVPIYFAPWFEKETVGIEMLKRLANALFQDEDPTEIKYKKRTFEILRTEVGYSLSIYLPFSDKNDLSLDLRGDELIVRTAKIKRSVTLPSMLAGREISSAKFEEDRLTITFSGA